MTASEMSEVIRQARKKRNLTLMTLAGLCGKGTSQVFKIENRPDVVTMQSLLAVLNALDCELIIRPKATESVQNQPENARIQ